MEVCPFAGRGALHQPWDCAPEQELHPAIRHAAGARFEGASLTCLPKGQSSGKVGALYQSLCCNSYVVCACVPAYACVHMYIYIHICKMWGHVQPF